MSKSKLPFRFGTPLVLGEIPREDGKVIRVTVEFPNPGRPHILIRLWYPVEGKLCPDEQYVTFYPDKLDGVITALQVGRAKMTGRGAL